MKTIDLTKALKKHLMIDKLYPNTLPDEDLATGAFVYGSETNSYVPRGAVSIQFLTSGKDRNACEQKSSEILEKLNALTFPLQIENTVIEGIFFKQIAPIYIGVDAKNNSQFSFNTIFYIEKQERISPLGLIKVK